MKAIHRQCLCLLWKCPAPEVCPRIAHCSLSLPLPPLSETEFCIFGAGEIITDFLEVVSSLVVLTALSREEDEYELELLRTGLWLSLLTRHPCWRYSVKGKRSSWYLCNWLTQNTGIPTEFFYSDHFSYEPKWKINNFSPLIEDLVQSKHWSDWFTSCSQWLYFHAFTKNWTKYRLAPLCESDSPILENPIPLMLFSHKWSFLKLTTLPF